MVKASIAFSLGMCFSNFTEILFYAMGALGAFVLLVCLAAWKCA